MRDNHWSFIRNICVAFAAFTALCLPPSVQAQTDTSDLRAPDGVSLTSLETTRVRIEERTDLDPDKRASALAAYDSAIAAMKNASGYLIEEKKFKNILDNSTSQIERLTKQIEELEAEGPLTLEDDMSDMNSQNLAELQQSLIIKEAELRILRARSADLTTELTALQNRRLVAPDEQTEALSRVKDISERLLTNGDPGDDIAAQATDVSLQTRLYSRRAQSAMLAQEIASFAERQKLRTAERLVTQSKAQKVNAEVEALQKLTGKKRLIDANSFAMKAEAFAADIESEAPFVHAYADENIEIAQSLNDIAKSSSLLPGLKASLRSRVDIIDADLGTTTSLIKLGNLSRQSAAMLRKLRNDSLSVKRIEADIKSVNEDIALATQSRLLAQDRLRKFSSGEESLLKLARNWELNNPEALPVTDNDVGVLLRLQTERRNILNAVANDASERVNELEGLKGIQKDVLDRTDELTRLLDQNLLWLPSIAGINGDWPKKVIKGALEVFSVKNIELVANQLRLTALDNLWLVALFVFLILVCYRQRKPLWRDVVGRSRMVGRVQEDSHWHTPIVLITCVIIAMPVALAFALVSILLILSGSPDPLIGSLASAFKYLSLFTLFFLSWRGWDRDLSLFDSHFNLPKTWRHVVNRQFRWFIPFVGTAGTLMVLTVNSKSPDVHDGFSLFTFLILSACLAVIFINVLWKQRHSDGHILSDDNALGNYKTPFAVLMIAFPVFSAIFAAAGYYETTGELFYRFFISGCLLVGTYVVHGVIGRSVMVSKRRLSLRQAIERRDKAVKLRAEQQAAEERGEITPTPSVDYAQIDVENINRQTLKLINTAMVLGFAVLMWFIWSELLPALTFFNTVELGHYMSMGPGGEEISTPITLWNIMQAFVIAVLTVLIARNLPSLLDIFAFSRIGFDAGTRYAIVTVMGYVIFGIGAFMALDRLGLQWSQLKWVITGLSVGIGLGLQKIIANFVSGLIILFERPVRLGDYVTIGEQSGTVTRIQIRATTLMDLDHREILIPNEALISERVTNWTLSNSVTRLIVPVGIAYGSDTDNAQEIMLGVLKENNSVLRSPPPKVVFTGFGDSSLDFELHAFLKTFDDRVPTRHALHMDINKALSTAGIEIPFPQRDLHIVSDKTKAAKPKPKYPPKKPKPA